MGGTDIWWVQAIALFEALFYSMKLLLFCAALLLLMAYGQATHVLYAVVYCATLSCITGFDGCARYRLLCEPMLTVGVACALWALYVWYEQRNSVIRRSTYLKG